jgi:hypothetical protein
MSLSAIEKLFVFRTNILVFLMALLVWCLGIATIYPPGALIVTFEAHKYTENLNMSVMNPPVPRNLDLAGNDTFPTLGEATFIRARDAQQLDESANPWQRIFRYGYVD